MAKEVHDCSKAMALNCLICGLNQNNAVFSIHWNDFNRWKVRKNLSIETLVWFKLKISWQYFEVEGLCPEMQPHVQAVCLQSIKYLPGE